jgi:predicted DNA binding protein
MEVTESIARAALDTLSSQIAVLDDDGVIRFTNRSWRSFGAAGSSVTASDMRGVNYLDSVDPQADEYADEAVDGIHAVLDGDTEEFSLEYPCHTEEEKRWFLMRATPFSIGADQFVTVAHIDITDRRLAELEAQAHAERAEEGRQDLEHLIDRINGLVQDITSLLVEATTRAEIETGVCERLAATDPYGYAWIGEADPSSDRIEPAASAGSDDVDIDDIEGPSTDADGPIARAMTEQEVTVVAATDPGFAALPGATDFESLVAVPLVRADTCYGVLVVYADGATEVDDRERVVLGALGRAIANAINALESKRTLAADSVVELQFTVEDEGLLECELTVDATATLSYSGSVYQPDGTLRMFYTVAGSDPSAVVAAAESHPAVGEVRRLAEYDDELLLQMTVDDSLVATLADRGGATQEITSEDGVARFTVEISRDTDARDLFEVVEDRYAETELVGYHEHERPVQTRQEFRANLTERLTDRQLTALRTAYHSGFFDWPRAVDGDELAAMMDISRSTFHQHLRVAERKVLDAFFQQS